LFCVDFPRKKNKQTRTSEGNEDVDGAISLTQSSTYLLVI